MSAPGTDRSLRSVVARALECSEDELSAHAGLNRHPAWDSLAHVAVIVAIEEEYGLTIDEAVLEQTTTLAGIATLVHEQLDTGRPHDG